MLNHYFFSLPDLDFKPTGSRDPLGLQVIWQNVGSQVIPFLSTVSSNIRDFKILCLAHYHLSNGELDRDTFIRFEQLCAYARHYQNENEAFNGIEKIRKHFRQELPNRFPIDISEKKVHWILSNQITYGIWGKYNRPFLSMDLNAKMEKIDSLFELSSNEKNLIRKVKRGDFKLNEINVKEHCNFLNLNAFDKHFFTKNILQTNNISDKKIACKHQNELFRVFEADENLTQIQDFFVLIKDLQEADISQSLYQALEEIKQTERVIAPLNRIFKHLQTKSIWKKNQDFSDLATYIEAIELDEYEFKNPETTKLQEILKTKDVWKIITGLVKVNTAVSHNRNKNAWLYIEEDNKLVFNEKNGARKISYWKDKSPNDFSYFFNTYLSLYHQIKAIA